MSRSVNKRKDYVVNVWRMREMHLPATSSFGAMAGILRREIFAIFVAGCFGSNVCNPPLRQAAGRYRQAVYGIGIKI
ncbi:hypothetical protein LJC68_10665 [Bacteroidales bacterium OttesenSCG-928-B11]|nr:hypothetical protein [Bacteroidales bacterium OttesenSCG-928-B11]